MKFWKIGKMTCKMKSGSEELIEVLQKSINYKKVDIQGICDKE